MVTLMQVFGHKTMYWTCVINKKSLYETDKCNGGKLLNTEVQILRFCSHKFSGNTLLTLNIEYLIQGQNYMSSHII